MSALVDPPARRHGGRTAASLPGRWCLALVAVIAGLFVGSLACAAGLGSGSGHSGAPVGGHGVVDVSTHHAHDHPADLGGSDARADAARHPGAGSSDTPDDAPALPGGHGHPGMACVVLIDLRSSSPTISSGSEPYEPAPVVPRHACSADVDPPVPRMV